MRYYIFLTALEQTPKAYAIAKIPSTESSRGLATFDEK